MQLIIPTILNMLNNNLNKSVCVSLCVYVCLREISEWLNLKNGNSYGTVFFRYDADKTLTKPISKFFLNRPVVSDLIDGFVPQFWHKMAHFFSLFALSSITAYYVALVHES